jgi:hypothetical protein
MPEQLGELRMAIELNFENNYRGVVLIAGGELSGDDLLGISEEVYGADALGKLEYQILDISSIDRIDINLPTIQQLAQMDVAAAEKNGGMKIAVVVKSGFLEALTETWARYSHSPYLQTKICADMATARSWISQTDLELMDNNFSASQSKS